jgi:hypothetical protein
MKKIVNLGMIWLGVFLMTAVSYDTGQGYCVLFPQNGRDIFGVAQRTMLVFGERQVSLIPQVHFEGDARDFGILVPTPAEPQLSTVGANIFSEASFLTQPIIRQTSNGCGCDGDNQIFSPVLRAELADASSRVENSASGVVIIQETIVGMFQAVVLQASSAADLTQWLNENQYKFDPADSDLLQQYVDDDWFFVAMKLDPNQVPQFVNQWWAATTSPAKITFDFDGSQSLTYPLKISSISTNENAEVLVYTIGNDPLRFPDAKLEYANAIDEEEADAIAESFPTLAQFAREGTFVTKLRRVFSKSEMQNDIQITVTEDREEFREVRYMNNSSVGVVGLVLLLVCAWLNRRKK